MAVDIGDVGEDAARWWTAVLSAGGGWAASIANDKGALLCSPWSIRPQSDTPFIPSPEYRRHSATPSHPASFKTAVHYLSEYCRLHEAHEQSDAAPAAALLIPVAKYDGRRIALPYPRTSSKAPQGSSKDRPALSQWEKDHRHLDRLLTLSCNARGVKTLLISIFFQPDIVCNVCGAWLEGSFAFLDSDEAKDPSLRLRMFIERDPGLALLWLGAFITGADARCIQDARAGWWKVDLSAAVWTGTHASFIQGPVSKHAPPVANISRADECRLLYLTHGPNHTSPPLFPFAPFGSTAMEDTDLDVRQHVVCPAVQCLGYGGFTWDCEGVERVKQPSHNDVSEILIRSKAPDGWSSREVDSIAVDYDNLDLEDDDETSEMVTRNIFTWLRGENGFPAAERAIRQHEWIDNLDSDDDGGPVEGEVRSRAGDNLGRWLLGVMTERCNSF